VEGVSLGGCFGGCGEGGYVTMMCGLGVLRGSRFGGVVLTVMRL
jgi:hypothetical protein